MVISQTDRAVIVVCGMALLTFLINAKLGSIWLLYFNICFTAGVFGYAIRKWDAASDLSRSVVFGVIASITAYIPLDWLFFRRTPLTREGSLIFFLRPDIPWMPAAPLSIILTGMIAVAIIIYLYHRLNAIWKRSYVSAVITAGVAFTGSVIGDALGSARLWNWNATSLKYFPYIGSVPAFVPIGLALAFLLAPYYFRRHHIIVSGIRGGLFIGIMQFFCFLFFYLVRF